MSRDEKIDLSILDPSLREEQWESRVQDVVAQSQLLRRQMERAEGLEQLDAFADERVFEQRLERVIRAVQSSEQGGARRESRFENQVTEVGPRALAVGAILAAATWLSVLWLDPPRENPGALAESPGLNLATWAQEGRVPETADILMVMEVAHVDD